MLVNLLPYIHNPEDPSINFDLAREYDSLGQTASALSFYLRCAERSTDPFEQYTALLHSALCFERQRCRDSTEKTLIQKAMALLPRRPEAYFLLSRLAERAGDWQECYTVACLGLEFCEIDKNFIEDVVYPGEYALLFQRGVAAWWVGHCEECREIMAELRADYTMHTEFAQAVENNLANLGWPENRVEYIANMQHSMRHRFPGLERIERNFAQSCQDLFVLCATDGKTGGTYLEIGSAEPFKSNNTALLETQFGWTGVSIDFNKTKVDEFAKTRKNTVLCRDATKIDYAELLQQNKLPQVIDYLQVDCDPPETSYKILTQIPFDQYQFACITFEHDYYSSPVVRDLARQFLQSRGYQLAAGNIAYDKKHSYEDWFVHPDLINPEVLNRLVQTSDQVKYARDYLFPSTVSDLL